MKTHSRGLVLATTIPCLALLLGACSSMGSTHVAVGVVDVAPPLEEWSELAVRTNVGDVRIEPSSSGRLELEASVRVSDERNDVTTALAERDVACFVDGEVLHIENAHLGDDDQDDWYVSFVVRTPTASAVRVTNGVGDVFVDVPCSAVEITGGVGDVEVHGVDGAATITSGTGSILVRAEGLQTCALSTGVGSIDVRTRSGPHGNCDLSSGTGSIEVAVGADFVGAVECSTGVGSIEIDGLEGVEIEAGFVSQSASGQVGIGSQRLHAQTGTGSIELRRADG